MDAAIDLRGLTKSYGTNRGIFDLNIQLKPGEIFGFLGPNGAGKTTAMKMMTGLVHPDAGDALILGHSIRTEPAEVLRHIGCILETAELYPYLTAEENLKQVTRFYPEIDDAGIMKALEQVGMERYAKEKTQKFSLGMKQRVGLAMTMVHKPKVMILDEPLNGLDVEGMVQVRNILQNLAERDGVTIFISSHLIHDVELTCTKIGIVAQGHMLTIADTAEIRREYPSLESFFIDEVNRHDRL